MGREALGFGGNFLRQGRGVEAPPPLFTFSVQLCFIVSWLPNALATHLHSNAFPQTCIAFGGLTNACLSILKEIFGSDVFSFVWR